MEPAEEPAAAWAQQLGRKTSAASQASTTATSPTETVADTLCVAHDNLGALLPKGHAEVLVLGDQPVAADGAVDTLLSISRTEDEAAQRRVAARGRQAKRPYEAWEEAAATTGGDDELMVASILRPARPKIILPHYDDTEDAHASTRPKPTLAEIAGQSMASQLATPRDQGGGGVSAGAPSSAKRKSIRKRIISFTDNPVPAAAVPLVPGDGPDSGASVGAAAIISLDDDDLQRSLAAQRKRHIRTSLADVMTLGEADQEDTAATGPVEEGWAFSESTDFISTVRPSLAPFPIATAEPEEPKEPAQPEPTQAADHPAPPSAVGDVLPVEKEPLVRRGVAATLAFLAKLGIRPQLATEKVPPSQRRRALDMARFEHIKIEHYDSEGHRMTPKEAYKHLSHKFHGKTPGKTKQEKIQRRREAERRRQAASLGDTPLGSASALRQHQKTTGDTFVMLQQGKHAVQSVAADKAAPASSSPQTRPAGKMTSHNKPAPASAKASTSSVDSTKRPRIFGMQ